MQRTRYSSSSIRISSCGLTGIATCVLYAAALPYLPSRFNSPRSILSRSLLQCTDCLHPCLSSTIWPLKASQGGLVGFFNIGIDKQSFVRPLGHLIVRHVLTCLSLTITEPVLSRLLLAALSSLCTHLTMWPSMSLRSVSERWALPTIPVSIVSIASLWS